jgi:hypothetical protein
MERLVDRPAAIGLSLAAGLLLWFCAFVLFRIGEGTEFPAVVVSSPLALFTLLLFGERSMIVGFLLAPAYWILLGWAASWRSDGRKVLLIVLLLGQYLGAAATTLLYLADGSESSRFQTEMERQPVAVVLFVLVYLLAHIFFWYSVGPIRLSDWRSGSGSNSSDGWWPRKPED